MNDTTTAEATGGAARALRRRPVKLAIDIVLLAGFIVEFVTREGPDYDLHSWVGIVLVPVIAIHLVGNAGWIARVWRRGRADREFGLAVLNTVFGILVAVCIVTGFPIWLEWSDAAAWAGVHTVTGLVAILVMLVHLGMNRRRIVGLLRRTS